MNLLLDTHVIIWWAEDDPRLSQNAIDAIDDPDNRLILSVVAAWEFQWLQMRRRIPTIVPIDRIIDDLALEELPFAFDLHSFSASLPPIHGDPMDRMMIAQALRHDLAFVTADLNIHKYPVKTFW
jgi:PIN domain nuclease of toxin-antitoxin system